MPSLIDLPNELLFTVLNLVLGPVGYRFRQPGYKYVADIARTCRAVHVVATEVLYRRDVSEEPYALHWAIRNHNLETAKRALEFGADVNVTYSRSTRSNGSPLHYAALKGDDAMVRLLLDHGARLDTRLENKCACQFNGMKYTPGYRDDHPNSDHPPQWFPLHHAICTGNETTAHLILDRNPPMHMRTARDTHDSVPTILHCAVARGFDSVVRRVLDMYPTILSEGEGTLSPLLHYTAECWQSKAVIQTLVSAGCDLEGQDRFRLTPIWYACTSKNFITARHLLAAGARADPVSPDGPLQLRIPHWTAPELPLIFWAVTWWRPSRATGYCAPPNSRSRFLSPPKTDGHQAAFVKALIEERGVAASNLAVQYAVLPSYYFAYVAPALIRVLLEKGASPDAPVQGFGTVLRVTLLDLLTTGQPGCDISLAPIYAYEDWIPAKYKDTLLDPLFELSDRDLEAAVLHSITKENTDPTPPRTANPWAAPLRRHDNDNYSRIKRSESDKITIWEVMTVLLKFGARLDWPEGGGYCIRDSLLFSVVQCVVAWPFKNFSQATLRFLLRSANAKTLPAGFLDDLLLACVMMAGSYVGREVVRRILVGHGASLNARDPAVAAMLCERFVVHDDIWLAMLCCREGCLTRSPEQFLEIALRADRSNVARYFLRKIDDQVIKTMRYKEDDDNNNSTPLHLAARAGDALAVSTLIKKGAEVNALNEQGCSPLHYAVSTELEECKLPKLRATTREADALQTVRVLLDNGADPFCGHDRSDVSLSQYLRRDDVENAPVIPKEYLIKGSAVSRASRMGKTKLAAAIIEGRQPPGLPLSAWTGPDGSGRCPDSTVTHTT